MGVAKRVRIGEDSLRALSLITEGIMTGDNSDTVGLSTLPADGGDRTLTPVVLLVRVHPLECVEASQNDVVNDLGTLVKSVVLFAKIVRPSVGEGERTFRRRALRTGRQ